MIHTVKVLDYLVVFLFFLNIQWRFGCDTESEKESFSRWLSAGRVCVCAFGERGAAVVTDAPPSLTRDVVDCCSSQ